ncbi:radical SAM protein [Rhizobium puerariae]|uniref:Radical SAM protein n=1 Tax=Rhizobium puerariae TaxID=1585791 RepID=A0ABV6AHI4_9HYPH
MRYILRNEFFGGLAYDRHEKDYIHLDHLAVRLLKKPSVELTPHEYDRFETNSDEVELIVEELRSRGIQDNVRYLDNKPGTKILSAPTRVFLEITYQCPEKCAHCYTESGPKRSDEMQLEHKLAIVDQMAEIGCYRLSIAGGEPLVDPDFFPVVERALNKDIDVSFSTSGIPVTDRVAKKLSELDVRTVNISLDGWDDTSYDIVRGSGRFKYMLRGVERLRRHYHGKLAAKCTLMTTNIRNLDKIIELSEALGFDVVKFNCVREAGRAVGENSLIPTQDEYIASMKYLADFYNSKKSKIKMVLPVNPYQKFEGEAPDVIGELGFGCYAGKESFCITATGSIQPCTSFGEFMFVDGNVRDTPLSTAWLDGTSMRMFRGLNGSTACQSCKSYAGCRGGCYLRSFTATGDMNATDPYCYEYRNLEPAV